MADRERTKRVMAVAAACVLAFGLGWAGATFRAVHEARARDQESFAAQRSRFELDDVMRKSDARIRPLLSPRQLAVYDQLQQERRRDLPERSGDTDD